MSRQSGRISADPKRVNSELFTLTYGSLLSQLVRDSDGNVEEVNKNLERIGYNIGMRLIEDYLARCGQVQQQLGGSGAGGVASSGGVVSGSGRCNDLKDTAEKIQAALRLYVSLTSSLSMGPGADEFTLTFDSCPFGEFVELPDSLLSNQGDGGSGLKYANVLPGIIRGACEMVQMEVGAWIEKDTLKGDSVTELKVKFLRRLHDALPAGED